MATVKDQTTISQHEYLAGERISDIKHELINGQVYAMAGASINHQRLCANVSREFGVHLKGSPCEALSSDMKVNVGTNFFYPDVIVDCDFDESQPYYTQSPIIIVEVLSKSTSRVDRTTKRLAYINLPSLQEYVLIEQDFFNVEVMRKSAHWQASFYALGDEVHFESIGLTLSVADMYDRVKIKDLAEELRG